MIYLIFLAGIAAGQSGPENDEQVMRATAVSGRDLSLSCTFPSAPESAVSIKYSVYLFVSLALVTLYKLGLALVTCRQCKQ